jgi:hypothetical protein
MKCPNCGKDMDTGYLTIPLHFGLHSVKWSDEPRHSILGDDIIYDPKQNASMGAGSAIPAERCSGCKIVVFNYSGSDDKSSFPSNPGMLVRRA